MKYAFFPGCVLESAAKEDYLATVAVAKKLGIELEEKKMLNEYHAAVYEKVGMYLEENEREWLKRYTRPI